MFNPGNFWENTDQPLTSPGASAKIPLSQTVATPNAAGSVNFTLAASDIANVTSNLTNMLSTLNGSAPHNYNAQQVLSTQNTLALFQTLSAGVNSFNAQQQNDIIITKDAIVAINTAGMAPLLTSTNTVNVVPMPFAPGPYSITVNDQYGIAEQPGTGNWFLSNNGDLTTWQALQQATSESYSDNLLWIDQLAGTVILFGAQSIEYWVDQGIGTFPYSRIDGAQQEWGLCARYSVVHIQNGIMFLGQNQAGPPRVLFIQSGYTPTPVSTSDIDETINSFTEISDAQAKIVTINEHDCYMLTFPTARRTFLFDATTQLWSEMQSGTISEYDRHGSGVGIGYNNTNIVGDASTGQLYIFDPANPTDNGYLIKREIDTMHVQNEGNWFTVNELWLDMEVGGGQQNGLGTNPQITLSWSKDNGKTFKGNRTKQIGYVGQYLKHVSWRMIGKARDFVFKFVMTDPVPFNVVAGSAEIDPSTEKQ